ncbi:TPA: TauD/TfdA family dioxygenase [Pseudomonas aeruginosa]|uniref:TauD/TfdA family dioxygenase n=1 Tax=Pseudomonas aeruginosa TaxID=287 RepID=UPI002231C614|nr:TauD/TfdA family dioxygenase [Pseudomonas aeruginosa]WJQ16887.1 TauD/TfdA family dioxygenase [Pseudomonas aeruginosa]HCL3751691.1 TauD/TfdA family dioxygenase [Pseudomonas aeruginosa]
MSASFSAPRLRPRQLSAGDLVEESLLDPANDYLRIVRARQPGMDLRQWIAAAGAGLRDSLLRHGGILFRGFAVDGAEGFSQAVQGFSPNMLDYLERAAARQEVAHRVFTSTEFSPDGWIPPHHEMSYSHNWPSYIHFYCQTPPATQGRTPLADERRVSARIPEAIRQRFLRHGVCYVRNYGPEIDLTWQEGFQTDSRAEVEAYCRQTGTQWTWLDDQRLNTRQVRQAMVRHPLSGEPLWFNHAHMFHVSNMPPALARALLDEVGEQGLPRNAYYGDGSPIEAEVLDTIRAAYGEETRAFAWERGDVLMLDNFISVHGREPYTGERKVLVAMTDLHVHQP